MSCALPSCSQPGTKTCSRCKKVSYCSKEHQREHWKVHKKVCGKAKKKSDTVFSQSDEPQVTREDQTRINRFGRLNQLKEDLKDKIAEKKSQLMNLTDGAGDIEMLLDDDSCMIKVGEVFWSVSNEDAEEFVEEQKATVTEELATLEPQVAKIEYEMTDLKSVLYGKFGSNINLDSDPDDISSHVRS